MVFWKRKSIDSNAQKVELAVIGLACRFPGASHYQEYWENLVKGEVSIQLVPKERWDWQAYYGDPGKEPGKTNIKHAGFIKDIDKFDAAFFGISPREADYMDPQHRLFLECAWHAIENAGYKPSDFSGTRTGVYCGVSKNDYTELMRENGIEIAPYVSTGTVHSLIANRVSFFLNLKGASEVVDTACSSSLVALNRAVVDIQHGYCDAAIVGGVNAILSPTMTIAHSRSGMLSVNGKIKTFDKDAEGYVRGEGVAAILIKSLHAAQAAGDHIWGIIKSVAIGHAGRSNFLTAPNADAQASVVQKAMESAQVCPTSLSYIECHGTGTKLGDPIEIEGLKKAYQVLLSKENASKIRKQTQSFCALGSAKPNIGHLEPVAGLAGLIKILLAMKHKQLPGLANYQMQNPYLDLTDSPFYILQQPKRWTQESLEGSQPLRAGLSSFGMGGVNAHAVVEEYIPQGVPTSFAASEFFIPFSTKKERLNDCLQVYLDFFARSQAPVDRLSESQFLSDLSYTLWRGRERYDERVAFVVGSFSELLSSMQGYLKNKFDDFVFCNKNEANQKAKCKNLPTPLQMFASSWVVAESYTEAQEEHFIKGQRIPLPGYPFARKPHWFDKKNETLSQESINYKIKLNEHLHYLAHHRIQEKLTLPGAAHFEFVRQALNSLHTLSSGIEFTHIYWLQPFRIEAQTELTVCLKKGIHKHHYHYTIFDDHTEYIKGSCTLTGDKIYPTIPDGGLDFYNVISKNEIYRKLRNYGIQHGEFFQVIEEIHFGENFVIAKAHQPHAYSEELKTLSFNPCLIDGVFQAVTHLDLSLKQNTQQQSVPFYLGKALFYRPLPAQFFIQVTAYPNTHETSAKYNMVIYDNQSKLIATFKEFKKKALKT